MKLRQWLVVIPALCMSALPAQAQQASTAPEQRWAGRIDTVSVKSLGQFLTARGARQLRITYQPGKGARPVPPPTSQPMRI